MNNVKITVCPPMPARGLCLWNEYSAPRTAGGGQVARHLMEHQEQRPVVPRIASRERIAHARAARVRP